MASRESPYFLGALTRSKSVAQIMAEVDGISEGHDVATSSVTTDASALLAAPGAPGLKKCLTRWDVLFYGVGSTVGAGIFVITGQGARAAGPAVCLSFGLAALCCLCSAFSYAEFAARVPVSGSAYTFTYVCLGELAAWFVGTFSAGSSLSVVVFFTRI